MQALALTINGLEDVSSKEIEEIIQTKCIVKPFNTSGLVQFEIKKLKDLCTVVYVARSILKAIYLYDLFKFKKPDEIYEKVRKIDFREFLKDHSFVVRCERRGDHPFKSTEIEINVAEAILKNSKYSVDLKNPDVAVEIIIIDDICAIGIDFTGERLNKRDYKVRLSSNPINPCVAYAMIRLSNWKTNEIILDPFCGIGIIPIEAALHGCNIPNNLFRKDKLAFTRFIKPERIFNAVDKKIKRKRLKIYSLDSSLNNVSNSKVNAKMATVNKEITFSKYEVEWLDIKLDKSSVSKIISFPPFVSARNNEQHISNIYKELFYQAEFILKKNGLVVLLAVSTDLLEKYSQQYNFKLEKTLPIQIGELNYTICIFSK